MAIIFKAMGIISDQKIVQMIGMEPHVMDALVPSLEECAKSIILTQQKALMYLYQRLDYKRYSFVDSARETLANGLLIHVQTRNRNSTFFR